MHEELGLPSPGGKGGGEAGGSTGGSGKPIAGAGPGGIVTGSLDPDNDGLSNDAEIARGTNPNNPDTDGDGFADGWELTNGFDPLIAADGGPVWVTEPAMGGNDETNNGTETSPYRTTAWTEAPTRTATTITAPPRYSCIPTITPISVPPALPGILPR
jgi:hypothetical protein